MYLPSPLPQSYYLHYGSLREVHMYGPCTVTCYAGPPSPPLNLLHSFGSPCLSNNTHVPTTISWSPPQSSEGSYPVEGYGLTITRLSDPAHVETSVWAESGTNSVTVPLLHSQTYRLNLFAISCGGVLRSRNDSINILPPLGMAIDKDYACMQGQRQHLGPWGRAGW